MVSLYRGTFVHCPGLGDLDILRDHLVAVGTTGLIAFCGPATSAEAISLIGDSDSSSLQVIPDGSFCLPTFCDLHLHAPQFLYQGTGLHLPLMRWLDEYAYKAEEKLDSDPELARRVYTRLTERLIENGTGTVLLFGTILEETNLILAEVMQAAGIRAFVGKLSMDISSRPSYTESSADASLAAAQSFIHRCRSFSSHLPEHERLVEPVITPRFIPTCSDALLAGLGKISENDSVRIQSHLAEAHDQVEAVRRERGAEDIDIFDQAQLLTIRTVQAHCTYLPTLSLSRLQFLGTSVAHCPLSNAYFSAQPFRLREALDAGVKIGLGTDIAGGYAVDVMSAMRWAVGVARMREGLRVEGNIDGSQNLSVDWKETLFLATAGGAKALGLTSGSGRFVVGAPFDAQHIQLLDPATHRGVGALDFFEEQSVSGDTSNWLSTDALEKWWCLGDARNRIGMWVHGRKLKP